MKSLQRILALVKKEVRQLRRDRLTFGMIVGYPRYPVTDVWLCHQHGCAQPGRSGG